MGSGAKIALVALLILMVVAVAKFVQNSAEDQTSTANSAAGAKKDGSRAVQPAAPSGLKVGGAKISSQQPGRTASGQSPAGQIPGAPPRPQPSQANQASSSPTTVGQAQPPAPAGPAATPQNPVSPQPQGASGQKPAGDASAIAALVSPPKAADPEPAKGKIAGELAFAGQLSRNLPSGSGGLGASRPEPNPLNADTVGTIGTGDAAAPAVDPAKFPMTHTIAAGDSYWKIAEKYYGSGGGKHMKLVAAANNNVLLLPGKTAKVPALPAEVAGPPRAPKGSASSPGALRAAPATAVVAGDAEFEYTVQKGETLWSIGQKFSRNWKTIEDVNNLSYTTLREGAKIRIPKKS